MKFLALLRGINVGGKNKVSMAELKTCFEQLGCQNVKTYINSGNVLFESDKSAVSVAKQIEELLPKKFHLDSELIKVLVLSESELQSVVEHAPKGFGQEPATYYSDVIFLMGITVNDAMPVFSPREGVDKVWKGTNVIYSQRLGAERVKSRLSKIVGTTPYKSMTIRSWGTTTKLLQLLQD